MSKTFLRILLKVFLKIFPGAEFSSPALTAHTPLPRTPPYRAHPLTAHALTAHIYSFIQSVPRAIAPGFRARIRILVLVVD